MEKYLQCDMFDFLNQQYKITKPIRLIELFGGIGSQAKALERLGADFTHYKLVEFDKYAVASYNAVHHTNFIIQDITKINAKDLEIVDTDKYEYIMCYSFPCQDLSLAGKCKGMEKGSGTRSGLLWEVERLLNECEELPQILIMENVTQVHSVKNVEDFKKWQEFLFKKGYTNHWQDLNSKDFGIPQNRDRCFMISILNGGEYSFPRTQTLKLKLKDLLEENVDEKYYLSDKLLTCFLNPSESGKKFGRDKNFKQGINRDIAKTITTHSGSRDADNYIMPKKDLWVVDLKHQLCNKLIQEKKVQEYDVIKHSYSTSRINNERPTVEGKNNKGCSPTLDTRCDCLGVCVNDMPNTKLDLRIRKLTPRECWRLMGFDDIDFDNASKVNSNAQLYKQAGNSIVVNVLEAIFKEFL